MSDATARMSGQHMELLIGALDSLVDGDLALEILISRGPRAIPYLADFLLKSSPRTIALPRCRAVRALGELGGHTALISYFTGYKPPRDAAVLFAEDAVRSAAAGELMRWKSEEVFQILLAAARQRATGAIVLALGEFCRPETVPLLFDLLEDDLCRADAMASLRKLPDATRQFGILSIRGLTGVTMDGASARCRRRATLQLLVEIGVTPSDWLDLRRFLWERDPGTVIATAQIGFKSAPDAEHSAIAIALLRAAERFDPIQEEDAKDLLDAHSDIAHDAALQLASHLGDSKEKPNWMSPSFRILNHLLGESSDHHTTTRDVPSPGRTPNNGHHP